MADLVAARRQEDLAIVVLVNFAVAFEVDATVQAGTFLVAFVAIFLSEYVVIVRRYALGERLLTG